MRQVHSSFDPISRSDARVLILGSAPSQRSLQASQYYAHPQNAFWDIMASWTSCPRQEPYPRRCQALIDCGIALWDVAQRFHRPHSSLDARLEAVDPIPLDHFLLEHPDIQSVLLNGAKATDIFLRHLLPRAPRTLQWFRLPSTSPAWAALPRSEKQRVWLEALARTSALKAQNGRNEVSAMQPG